MATLDLIMGMVFFLLDGYDEDIDRVDRRRRQMYMRNRYSVRGRVGVTSFSFLID